ncbi:hypothetical protein L3Q82_007643 [Scortum barcoo]|uniref:Uncharacterized protein n=1 Tax=Scortum barcoo TaxID=214431 RepID=A0ACB8WNU0_9TELE|nr:hypothetical protein L3Q82_007643 [Scortum barcoo]
MKSQQRPSLLALSALLLCTAHLTAGSHLSGSASSTSSASSSSESQGSRPPPKLKEGTGQVSGSSFNTSRGNISTVISGGSGGAPSWIPDGGVSPLCAYRVIEGGIGGQLCFRHTLPPYECRKGDCRTAVSAGSLVANVLVNGSVLLQWNDSAVAGERGQRGDGDPGTNLTREETLRAAFAGRRHRRGGYELSCWWNGSYTQFECAGVHLGAGCRDFLLTELHENIPYRICLRALARRAERRDCVEFTLPPSGMQDIVIAMTTVGGAICVMLVIICLLVAYITENIMSPTTQHTKRGFDVRSFGTGSHVKLPGPAPDKPNVYDFKTTYVQMYNDLVRKDKELYTQNGILHMLDRNKRIKSKPERFQNCKDKFDLVITCEERVYDQVLEDLNSREQETLQPVHVINVDIQDNHEEATLGAFLICELCQCIQHTDDMENEIDELLQEFEDKSNRPFLHTVCFY